MLSPIAYRELLVQARSKGLHRSRIFVSVFLLCWGGIFAAVYHFGGLIPAGQMFPIFGSILLMLSLFGGSQSTADAISVEKREGTLGLLFLTPLKSGDVVIGKLVANGLPLVYVAITAFPLLSLVFVAGGVQGKDLITLFAATLGTLYFSTAAGLFVSSLGRDRKRVAGHASWIAIAYWILPRIVLEYLRAKGYPSWTWQALLLICPPFAYGPGAAPAEMMVSLVGTLVLGSLFLLGAWYFVPRRWQDKAERGEKTWRARWRQHWYGRPEVRAALRTRLLEHGPFYWLCARDRWKVVANILITAMFLGGAAWIVAAAVPGGGAVGTLAACAAALTFMQKIGISAAAANPLIDEAEQGTLELMLSTPLSAREILYGQLRAIVRQNRWPYLAILGMQVLALGLLLAFMGGTPKGFILGGLVILLHAFDLYTLAHIAPWCVTRVKQPRHAPQTALLQVVMLPGLIVGLGLGFLGYLTWQFSWSFQPNMEYCAAIYFLLAFGLNVRSLWLVRKYFEPSLRKFAAHRYHAVDAPAWWVRVFGWFSRKRAPLSPQLP